MKYTRLYFSSGWVVEALGFSAHEKKVLIKKYGSIVKVEYFRA